MVKRALAVVGGALFALVAFVGTAFAAPPPPEQVVIDAATDVKDSLMNTFGEVLPLVAIILGVLLAWGLARRLFRKT
jgi:hypothetical protein